MFMHDFLILRIYASYHIQKAIKITFLTFKEIAFPFDGS